MVVEPIGSTADEFVQIIKDEAKRWTAVAKAANIKPE